MKKTIACAIVLLLCVSSLDGQEQKTVTVEAGTRISDSFTHDELFLYPEFIQGKISFKDGTSTVTRLNYSTLAGEMLFIASGDTLAIANPRNILYVQIMLDTFFYDNAYLEVIAGAAPTFMACRHYIKIQDIKKEGAMGFRSSTNSAETYQGLYAEGNYRNMILQEDMVLSLNNDYYLGNPEQGFMLYKKSNVMKLFADNKAAVNDFVKNQDIDFKSKEDLLKLTGFLQQLK
jgi:hypothetical protein